MSCLGTSILRIADSQCVPDIILWRMVNDIMGTNDMKYRSSFNSRQIIGNHHKYTDKMALKLEDYVPFNLVLALYTSIRPNYKKVLDNILNSLLKDENQK